MATSKLKRKLFMLLAVAGVWTGNGLFAQVIPVVDGFRGRIFDGTVYVSRPVLFDSCTFVTDSVVLDHSYGAVFRNCCFESRTGRLYIAGTGDGIIMADCDVTGCDEFRFSIKASASDRNYITGVKVNDDECTVLDEQESIIDIEGLELEDVVRGKASGPMLMLMSADRQALKNAETAMLTLRGLDKGMFVGWHLSDTVVDMMVQDEFTCKITAPDSIGARRRVVVSAYTEYGLEAACVIELVPQEQQIVVQDKKARKKQEKALKKQEKRSRKK